MSWLNNSFNTIKGQLSTLAQEVLAETAGPGDAEYRGPLEDEQQKSVRQLLTETQAERDELLTLCQSLKLEVNACQENWRQNFPRISLREFLTFFLCFSHFRRKN